MNKIEIRKFLDLDDAGLEQASKVFVESYGDGLVHLSRDKAVLVEFMKHSFVVEQFYAALWDGKVVGIMACSTSQTRSLAFSRSKMQQLFGFKGRMLYSIFARMFHTRYVMYDDECYIEAVATDPEWRGRGIASTLLTYFLEQLPYRVYHLEVADTNTNAIRLYRKHGFVITGSRKQRFFRKLAGLNETYYMKKTTG